MNVCIVIGDLSSGGAERVAATLAGHWVEKGWRVTLVTFASRENDFYVLAPCVDRVALDMAASSRNHLDALRNNIARVLALRQLLKCESPDITLGFMPSSNILCGLAVIGTGLVAAGSEHIHPPMMPLSRLWRNLRRLVYPHLAFVSALTTESARWLKACTGARCVPVIPNPVGYPLSEHEPFVDPRALRERLGGGKLLLAVGRLAEQKGFDRLLAAFAKVGARFPSWKLVVLGEGPMKAGLEQQAIDLGLASQVALPGAVGNMGDWYKAADAYVMTSRFEGFGNTLAEALSYGLPAIAVDCETGPRYILRHEIDGLLVPPEDLNALSNAIDRLLGDESLRACFAARAVEVRERFSIERISALWEKKFNEFCCKDAPITLEQGKRTTRDDTEGY